MIDSVFLGSTSPALTQIVNKADTMVSLTSSVDVFPFNQPVTFTAIVSVILPGNGTPTGVVVFKDGTNTLDTSTINSSGIATFTTNTLSVGTHSITAVYNGDTNFNGNTSQLLTILVTPADTTTTLIISTQSSVFGQPVTFTAMVSISPSDPSIMVNGIVTFKDGATTLGSATLNNGTAIFTTNQLSVGTHSILAMYDGNNNFMSSVSTSLSYVVNKAKTSITLTSSMNPVTLGQIINFTANVNVVSPGSGIPIGIVTFNDGSTVLGSVTLNDSGQAVLSIHLTIGTHPITASYSGDGNFNSVISDTLNQVINPVTLIIKKNTQVTLTSSPTRGCVEKPVKFTATVTSVGTTTLIPSGTVTFDFDDCTPLINVTMDSTGVAKICHKFRESGTYNVRAIYNGDTNFNVSSTSLTIVIKAVNKCSHCKSCSIEKSHFAIDSDSPHYKSCSTDKHSFKIERKRFMF